MNIAYVLPVTYILGRKRVCSTSRSSTSFSFKRLFNSMTDFSAKSKYPNPSAYKGTSSFRQNGFTAN